MHCQNRSSLSIDRPQQASGRSDEFRHLASENNRERSFSLFHFKSSPTTEPHPTEMEPGPGLAF
jgi:hypothetical protein